MVRLATAGAMLALLLLATPAGAHQAPFTYLDVRVQGDQLELSLVAHAFDIAHDVGLEKPEQLFDEGTLRQRGPQFASLLPSRVRFVVDGVARPSDDWVLAESLPDRQSVRFSTRVPLSNEPGVVQLEAWLFPYDTAHQTFVNFQEDDVVTSQTILDAFSRQTRYFAGTRPGVWAAARATAARGLEHVALGPEHAVMLLGLLLLPVTRRQWTGIVVAFAVGHVVTLWLATYWRLTPPPRLVDPAVALAIVYVGTDNMMSSGGRDIRVWLSLALGAIHGFGLAPELRSMGLSRPGLAWSVVSLHLGLVFGQVALAAAVTAIVATARNRLHRHPAWLTLAGSVGVILVGAVWFVQRVFFPGATLQGLVTRL